MSVQRAVNQMILDQWKKSGQRPESLTLPKQIIEELEEELLDTIALSWPTTATQRVMRYLGVELVKAPE